VATTPLILVVNPQIAARSVKDLIALAKAPGAKFNYAAPGVGSLGHLAGELFKSMTGCEMLHVPYKGAGPALTDLIGGQVHVLFDNLPSSIGHIKGGKIRAHFVPVDQAAGPYYDALHVEPVLRPIGEDLEHNQCAGRGKLQSYAGDNLFGTCRSDGLVLEWKRPEGYIERYPVARAQQEHAITKREFARTLDPRLERTKQLVDVTKLVADSRVDGEVGIAGEARFTPALDGDAADETETPALSVTKPFDVDRGGEDRIHAVACRCNRAC
jgi:hypothetical protein